MDEHPPRIRIQNRGHLRERKEGRASERAGGRDPSMIHSGMWMKELTLVCGRIWADVCDNLHAMGRGAVSHVWLEGDAHACAAC